MYRSYKTIMKKVRLYYFTWFDESDCYFRYRKEGIFQNMELLKQLQSKLEDSHYLLIFEYNITEKCFMQIVNDINNLGRFIPERLRYYLKTRKFIGAITSNTDIDTFIDKKEKHNF